MKGRGISANYYIHHREKNRGGEGGGPFPNTHIACMTKVEVLSSFWESSSKLITMIDEMPWNKERKVNMLLQVQVTTGFAEKTVWALKSSKLSFPLKWLLSVLISDFLGPSPPAATYYFYFRIYQSDVYYFRTWVSYEIWNCLTKIP